MDVSGKMDNYQYLGVILGEKNNLEALYRRMGSPTIHMSGLEKGKQQKIIQQMIFDQNHRIAICVRIDRKLVIQEVENRRIAKYRRMPKGKLFAMFEEILFKYLRHQIEKYTLKHHMAAENIPVECDDDSLVFAKAWRTRSIQPAGAHFIADVLAWCNTKNITLNSVIELNYSDRIKKDMLYRLQK